MGEENKGAMITSEDGASLMKMNSITVKGEDLCVNGALMGAWDTDMFMTAEGVRSIMKSVDYEKVIPWIVEKVLGGSIKKL